MEPVPGSVQTIIIQLLYGNYCGKVAEFVRNSNRPENGSSPKGRTASPFDMPDGCNDEKKDADLARAKEGSSA